MQLILASNSPRRKELLEKNGVKFNVIISNYEEVNFSNDPVETAVFFAFNKAKSVFDSLKESDDIVVLGADTVVFFNGKILGKPSSEANAKEMLKSLSGKTHQVITGYALIGKGKIVKGHVESKVKFNDLNDEDIDRYIDSGLYKGKAGSYGIQDGYKLVKGYVGSYENIVGLPTAEIMEELKNFY